MWGTFTISEEVRKAIIKDMEKRCTKEEIEEFKKIAVILREALKVEDK